VGEQRYVADEDGPRISFPRQALHAHALSFAHPVSGRTLRFESPLPDDLSGLVGRLRPRGARRR